jgi:hypothetical protein
VPRTLASLVVLLLLTVACTGQEPAGGDAAPADEPASAADEPAAEPDPDPRTCRVDALEEGPVVDLRDADPVVTSHELAQRTHTCADTVVVALDDAWAAALAVSVAVDAEAPLLLTSDGGASLTSALVEALEPDQVLSIGLPDDGPAAAELDGATPVRAAAAPASTPTTLALSVLEHLGGDRAYAVAIGDDESRAAAIARNGGATPLLPIPDEDDALVALAAELPGALRVEVVAADEAAAASLAERLVDVGVDAEPADGPRWDGRVSDTVWLVDPREGATIAAVAATAAARDETLLPIDGRDLRAGRDRTERLADADPTRTVLVGDVTDHAEWQLPTLLEGPRLPTGGLTLFEHERIVALYGTPSSTVLGALGEQDLDATVARAREVAEPYGADGREVVPAFEIIVTIASAEAGDQGDYSRRLDPDSFRPWIDRAAEEGFHVILDLQPGRTDFLSQAKEYEELLREPHVGLALDPEWRLEDDQVHLRQIGSVDAAEVQEVADWLAALVREHRLPQKLLVLHQFRFSMLPDRDDIVAPPELAVVVHMDGQGPIGDKYETYDAITPAPRTAGGGGGRTSTTRTSRRRRPSRCSTSTRCPVFVTYQ